MNKTFAIPLVLQSSMSKFIKAVRQFLFFLWGSRIFATKLKVVQQFYIMALWL